MSECNSIVRYGDYIFIYQCHGRQKGRKWYYHVINDEGDINPDPITKVHQPVKWLSVTIPLSKDIKPNQIRQRRATCVERFYSKVGLDPLTGIYGLRFNILNPFKDFTISFNTPGRKPMEQTLGFIINESVYNSAVISSPGPERLPFGLFKRQKKCC